MNDLTWQYISMGILCILAGIAAYVFGLLSVTGLIILVIFGGGLTILSGMPIWKTIFRRIKPRLKHQ